MLDYSDIEQRYDIAALLYNEVMQQENDVIRQQLLRFRSENVTWILNYLQATFDDLEHALNLEEENYRD